MPVRIVQSKQNERVKDLRRALKQDDRASSGLVALEGPNLLAEALRSRLRPVHVFVAQETAHLLDGLHLEPETNVLLLPRELLCGILATETPQPVAALVQAPSWTWKDLLGWGPGAVPLLVVLCGLQDPGNVGTILRSAEAFGATGIVSLPETVSAWNQKAIRASAGSIFRMPHLHADWRECIAQLREAGIRTLITAARGGERATSADLRKPVALFIGNEGRGVPAEVAAHADGAVTIPCPGPVESLNAAVATSVLLYEAVRQRETIAVTKADMPSGRAR